MTSTLAISDHLRFFVEKASKLLGLRRGISGDFLPGLLRRRELEALVADLLVRVRDADIRGLQPFHFLLLRLHDVRQRSITRLVQALLCGDEDWELRFEDLDRAA